jgi:alpha-galactosidase
MEGNVRIRPACLVTFLLGALAAGLPGQAPRAAAPAPLVAVTPPMGWNSWDAFGTSVTEAEVKANADYMAAHLKQHGWRYIVVDIQWSEPDPRAHGYRPDAALAMDDFGRLLPAPNRFPSSAGGRGFQPLADYVHRLGLEFGIHIMRGIPRRAVKADLPVFGSPARAAGIADPFSTCPWNGDMYGVDMSRPHAQDYYDSILRLYAGWGVDYIKADDIARPAHREEIAALHRAIVKTGRPIVLSLSPGPAMVNDAEFLRQNANLWRVSDDFWDEWRLLRLNFTLLSIWSGYGRPGAWPDADMLPLGHIGLRAERGEPRTTRFTPDEQRTVMSLWSIAQSPLMFGGHLPDNDDFTTSLITNDEVLAVNQRGARGRAVAEGGDSVVWMADGSGPRSKYLGVFNVGDRQPIDIRVEWRALGLPARCTLRDLWEKKDVGAIDGGYTFRVAPHASGMYRLDPLTGAAPSPAR